MAEPQLTPTFHLPPVQIPIFNGDISNYQTFWDLFSTMIDQANASAVLKFSYLMTKLIGEPYELIKNLPLTSDNYEAAKELLQQRYGNKQAIERLVRSQLFALKVCKTKLEVRKMFYLAEAYIRQLETIMGRNKSFLISFIF